MATELQTVSFDGDDLAVIEESGVGYVSIRHVCDALGLGYSAQLVKLKRLNWACVSNIDTRDAGGRTQELAMIPVKSLPMWMATVSTNRVSADIRTKLEKYQLEAAEVLAKHFMGGTKAVVLGIQYESGDAQSVLLATMLETRTAVLQLEKQQAESLERLNAVAVRVEDVEARTDVLWEAINADRDWFQVKAYAALHRYKISKVDLSRLGKLVAERCRTLGIEPKKVPDGKYGVVNAYPLDVLNEFRGEFARLAEKPALKALA